MKEQIPIATVNETPIRLNGVDSLKSIAVLAIILIHFFPAPEPYYSIVSQLTRFAVPFFFIASGFFYAQGICKRGWLINLKRSIKRLFVLYLVWWCIYVANPSFVNIRKFGLYGSYLLKWKDYTGSLEKILLMGPAPHLWFLISLILSIIAFNFLAFILKKKVLFIFIFSIILYVIGVLGGSYSITSVGIHIPINTRDFIFFSMLPFCAGYAIFLKRDLVSDHFFIGLIIFFIGFMGHLAECRWLKLTFGVPPADNDYVFSTILMGIGAFVMSLSRSQILDINLFVKLGRLSLGMYLVHILVLYRVPYLEPFFSVTAWIFIGPLLAYFFCALLCFSISKVPYIKRIVI
jgi:peptidoglycan/LPS O-acetylase OafA/YrhL